MKTQKAEKLCEALYERDPGDEIIESDEKPDFRGWSPDMLTEIVREYGLGDLGDEEIVVEDDEDDGA